MAAISNITNPVWCISTKGPGIIVEGVNALTQAIELCIKTTKGSDPMRPNYGSNIFTYIDQPSNIAIPNIKREILDAIEVWEKRVKIIGITHYLKAPGSFVFEIIYKVVNTDIIERIVYDAAEGITTGSSSNELILQAYIPINPKNYRYTISFEKNGNLVTPFPSPSGYIGIDALFKWIQNNLFFTGRWFLQIDKIVCYMKADGVTSASLSIEVLPITIFEAEFPSLVWGQKYGINLLINGQPSTPSMPNTFITPGSVLAWVQSNWANYATWNIEFIQSDINAEFSDEFGEDFLVPSTGYKLIGISSIEGLTAELSITSTL